MSAGTKAMGLGASSIRCRATCVQMAIASTSGGGSPVRARTAPSELRRKRRWRHAPPPLPPELARRRPRTHRSEEHTSELQSRLHLVCRLLLEKKKKEVPKTSIHHRPPGHHDPHRAVRGHPQPDIRHPDAPAGLVTYEHLPCRGLKQRRLSQSA